MSTNPYLDHALAMAERGFYVFPVDHPALEHCAGIKTESHDPATCTERGKHPCVAWSFAATTSTKMISTWWRDKPLRNLGVNCRLSGLIVVDEDLRGEFARFAADNGHAAPDTFTVETAKGAHYYFRAPEGFHHGNRDKAFAGYHCNLRGNGGDKVDAEGKRSGAGGYVVGPGSVHATGVEYTITNAAEPVELPQWIIDALVKAKPTAATTATTTTASTTASTGSVWDHPDIAAKPRLDLASLPDVIPVDSRHDTLMRYACRMRQKAMPVEEAEVLLRKVWERCEQPTGNERTWDHALGTLRDVYGRYAPGEEYQPTLEALQKASEATESASLLRPGGSFVLDIPDVPAAVWGAGNEVLWADGEALMVVGPQGTGKSTLGQQLTLGRCGFAEYAELLGYPITPGSTKTLYLAMDRPKQIARSFRRMVGAAWRDELDAKLVVWPGPPPVDIAKAPLTLLQLCLEAGADTVVVDSLKDAALGLAEDEAGAGYNRARQHVLAAGVQVLELHHQRKAPQGPKQTKPTISDVYGSTWITSGSGSVILLEGAPGDPVVSFHHVKQPLDEVGPLQLLHDHDHGRTEVHHSVDLVVVARIKRRITAEEAAAMINSTAKPTAAQREKARRRLNQLTQAGLLVVVEQGDQAMNKPTVWRAS